jgi:hypothetical protein
MSERSGLCDDGGHKLLWNAGQYLTDYMVVRYLIRQPYSYLLLWEPEVLPSALTGSRVAQSV